MKVAVLLPVYNGERTIERSIKSLLEQTYDNWDLIFVDNGSTDSTVKIVESLMASNKKDWTLLNCQIPGIVPALNKGLFTIMSSDYDLIARLDADDFWYSEKLEKQVKFLSDNPKVSILGTQINRVDSIKFNSLPEQIKYPITSADIKKMLLSGNNAIAHPSVVFKPEIILTTGGYDSTYPVAEDYHLWLKALHWFDFANLDEVLVDYTVSHNPKYNPHTPKLCCYSIKSALSYLY